MKTSDLKEKLKVKNKLIENYVIAMDEYRKEIRFLEHKVRRLERKLEANNKNVFG